jgi:hypothetical protein
VCPISVYVKLALESHSNKMIEPTGILTENREEEFALITNNGNTSRSAYLPMPKALFLSNGKMMPSLITSPYL